MESTPPAGDTPHPLVQLRVHGHDEDDGGVRASQRRQQQEAGEVGVVLVAAAVVDPGTVVVHLHHAPAGGRHRATTSFTAFKYDIIVQFCF